MAMKGILALLLVTFGNAVHDESTEFESDAMDLNVEHGDEANVVRHLSEHNTFLAEKVRVLERQVEASQAREAELEAQLAEAIEKKGSEEAVEEVASLVDVEDEANGPDIPLLEYTPRQLLKYSKSTCGRKWPVSCAAEDSATTGATDGFICDPSRGGYKNIADMTVYKLAYKFKDAGPTNEAGFNSHPRCRKGRCESRGNKLKKTPILKISQIGAKICQWALKAPTTVQIDVGGRKESVAVEVIESKTANVEDISVKLSIPIAAVTFKTADFSGIGKSFLDEAAATNAIKASLDAVGAVSSAINGKVCGHGFTSGTQARIDELPDFFKDLVEGRAAAVAQVAMAQAGNANVNTYEGVAHLVHVDIPSAGLIVKLNGASSEACAAGDWVGAPLP